MILKFVEKLHILIDKYTAVECGMRDNAFLYGICNPSPPLAEHIIFSSMPEDVMQGMINAYKLEFPQELLDLYGVMNGANLFWSVDYIGKKKIRIPFNYLSIYGIPLTYDRMHIEPYNISIEDLNRPRETPDNWLKFGSYQSLENSSIRFDLYVDTDTDHVFSVEHGIKICTVTESWKSIDECLCFLLDTMIDGLQLMNNT